MQLIRTITEQLKTDKEFLDSTLTRHGMVEANVLIQEESREGLMTLLMTNDEIYKDIKQAVKEVFGVNYVVSDIYMGCGKRLFTFKISKNC